MSQKQDLIFFRNFSVLVALIAIALAIFLVIAIKVSADPDARLEQRAEAIRTATKPVGQVALTGEEEQATEQNSKEVSLAEAGEISGEKIYNGLCVSCHSIEGIGAPVLGNVASWAPRIEKGIDGLYNNAINGFTGPEGYMMPARGGGNFSDDEVKAAVDYMVENSQ